MYSETMSQCLRYALLSVGVLAFSALAQETTNQPPARKYDRQIQMYKSPITAAVPNESLDDGKPLFSSDDEPLSRVTESSVGQPMNAAPVRLRKDSKPKNWILPPKSTDEKDGKKDEDDKTDEDQQSGTRDKEKSSGWGWLADDVQNQQKKADKQQKEDEADNDKDNPKALPLQHDMDKNATKGSLLLDARYEPTRGTVRETDKRDVMSMVTTEEEEKKADRGKPIAGGVAHTTSSPVTPLGQEQKFGAATAQGSDRVGSGNEDSQNELPQTATLLSVTPQEKLLPTLPNLAATPSPGLQPPVTTPDPPPSWTTPSTMPKMFDTAPAGGTFGTKSDFGSIGTFPTPTAAAPTPDLKPISESYNLNPAPLPNTGLDPLTKTPGLSDEWGH